MIQTIVHDYPPLFDEIDRAFRVRGRPVIYAWGDRVFSPMPLDIPPHLLAHEAVHGERQGKDIVGWWRRYIEDPRFRLAEEIPAHQAEYRCRVRLGNRVQRRCALKEVVAKLASPLYGRLIGPGPARAVLQEAC